jgi:hypothetical protein
MTVPTLRLSSINPSNSGVFYLLVTAFSWGLNYPVLKFIITAWPPFTFRLLTGIAGAAFVAAIALMRGERLRPRRGQWTRLVIASVLNLTSWMVFATASFYWRRRLSPTRCRCGRRSWHGPFWASAPLGRVSLGWRWGSGASRC